MRATITSQELLTLSQAKSAAALPVYLATKMRAFGAKTTSYPTRKTIRKDLGDKFSLITITKAISELVKLGMIRRLHDAAKNLWYFVFPEKEEAFGKANPKRRAPSSQQNTHKKIHKEKSSNNTKIMNLKSGAKSKADKNSPVKRWLNFALNQVLGLGKDVVPNPAGIEDQILSEISTNEMYLEFKDEIQSIIVDERYDARSHLHLSG